jgi:hypothetical protein
MLSSYKVVLYWAYPCIVFCKPDLLFTRASACITLGANQFFKIPNTYALLNLQHTNTYTYTECVEKIIICQTVRHCQHLIMMVNLARLNKYIDHSTNTLLHPVPLVTCNDTGRVLLLYQKQILETNACWAFTFSPILVHTSMIT